MAEAVPGPPLFRILVCGGRDYHYYEKVRNWLDRICYERGLFDDEKKLPRVHIIHGGAPGADLCADIWAVTNWTGLTVFKAEWGAQGYAAGPIRNQRMLDEGKPDLVVAFPGGRGTADMVRRAREAGVVVVEVPK